ncbi:hypothetical protein JHK85_034985 [Glycine max]|nr:hypothetical protein JHK85_034985 [Glycine max]
MNGPPCTKHATVQLQITEPTPYINNHRIYMDQKNCLGKREPLPNWHYTSPNFANPRRPHVTLTLIPVPFLVTIFIRPRHATPLIKRGRFPVGNVLVQFRAGEHAANAVINLNTFYAG